MNRSTVNDIVKFIRKRLAEDEAAALAASSFHWSASKWSNEANREFLVVADETSGAPAFGIKDQADAAHIVAHDPARIIRQVKALRLIVDRCDGLIDHPSGDETTDIACEDTLRDLVQIWTDHRDFQEKWA